MVNKIGLRFRDIIPVFTFFLVATALFTIMLVFITIISVVFSALI